MEAAAGRTPWERADPSFPADLFRSWMECMTRPGEFFARVDPDVPFSRPLLFFLLFTVLGAGLGSLAADAALQGWMADAYAEGEGVAPGGATRLFWFFASPFVGLLGLAINVGLVHLGVRVFVTGARSIGVTARGLCYVSAPQVLAVVPFLGWVLVPVWGLVLAVVGMRELHGTSTGRAAAAVLVPLLLFWFLIAGFAFFLVFVVLVAAGAAA